MVLGPALFLIYVTDICEAVLDLNIRTQLSADDAKMYSVLDSGLSRDLNTACSRIALWAGNWLMHVASNKCIALRIANNRSIRKLCTSRKPRK
jgi:hypothetical protein